MDISVILDILIVIGIIITFIYQKTKIDSLQISLTAVKSYMDIFNLDEVKKYVELKSEKLEIEKQTEIDNITKELTEKHDHEIKERSEKTKLTMNFIFNRMSKDIQFAAQALIYVPPHKRLDLVNNVYKDENDEQMAKTLTELVEKMDIYWNFPEKPEIDAYVKSSPLPSLAEQVRLYKGIQQKED